MTDWVVRLFDEKERDTLADALSIDHLQAQLLAGRGIDTVEKANKFLFPSLDHLHDPFLFTEMKEAVSILEASLKGGEKILIHGDYDADGICGTALLFRALRKFGADVHYFVPDRAKDGYGLSMRMMERGVEKGLGLVISVDCGSSDDAAVLFLADTGIKTIITDHHEINRRIPEADAFINPKAPGETYPFTELAGVGVAFKLIQGLEKQSGKNAGLEEMLDLVAVGTLGDYVVLEDENRVLVSLGLLKLGEWDRQGFRALQVLSNLAREGFSARQVCFTIVPRLNSPGRIGSARDVVRLLTTDDTDESFSIGEVIEEQNSLRRELDSVVTEQASYLADINIGKDHPNALVFSSQSWHEGVVGIAASRLAEKYSLPAVLIADKGEIGKGSVRSAGMINVRETLEKCSEFLMAFGGHKEAGGFSIRTDDVYNFRKRFNKVAGESMDSEKKWQPVTVDGEIEFDQCNLELISFLERMGPYGPGNREPLLMLKNLEVGQKSRIVGNGHLKISASDTAGARLDLIGFSLGRAWNPADIMGKKIDVLINLRMNSWKGRDELQFQVTAIRYSEKKRSNA